MPRGFDEQERGLIKRRLLDAGRAIFSRYGFKKASLDDIVRKAGISKGAFYLFFESKELFFMEVLEYLEAEFRNGMTAALSEAKLSPEKRLKTYIAKAFEFMEQNPLLLKLQKQDLEAILIKLPEEKMKRHLEHDAGFLLNFLSGPGGRKASQPKYDAKGLHGLFMFFFILFRHKDEMDPEEFRKGTGLLTDMLCKYFS